GPTIMRMFYDMEVRHDPDSRTDVGAESARLDLAGGRPAAAALQLLSLLLFSAQLLAGSEPAVAGAAGASVRASAGLHGLPALQGAGLALRVVHADEILPRQPLLAGSVLKSVFGF